MVAHAFDHRGGAGVADGEAFAGAAVAVEGAAGGAVERGVAEDGVGGGIELRVGGDLHDDLAGGHALASVVIGLAGEFDLHAGHQEGAERLAGRAAELEGDGGVAVEAAVAVDLGDPSGQAGADVAVGVEDVVAELDRLAVGQDLDRRGDRFGR